MSREGGEWILRSQACAGLVVSVLPHSWYPLKAPKYHLSQTQTSNLCQSYSWGHTMYIENQKHTAGNTHTEMDTVDHVGNNMIRPTNTLLRNTLLSMCVPLATHETPHEYLDLPFTHAHWGTYVLILSLSHSLSVAHNSRNQWPACFRVCSSRAEQTTRLYGGRALHPHALNLSPAPICSPALGRQDGLLGEPGSKWDLPSKGAKPWGSLCGVVRLNGVKCKEIGGRDFLSTAPIPLCPLFKECSRS